ncbi:DUF1566 domain-containing protein [Marinobacter sp. ES-1]|uniref:Lcl domain-containing protein n=1 Tax=Marinobacter sp. ES-1 TaxID=1396858 RepID=UPI0004B8A083|nr:DUF1566 domain-containing protein [Marinobacter sp. ES-1]
MKYKLWLAGLILLLAGCGGGGSSTSDDPSASQEEKDSEKTAQPEEQLPTPTNKTYQLTTNVKPGGFISPTEATVEEGLTQVFELTAQEGYKLNSVQGCSGNLSGSTYTTGAISTSCSVTVEFALLPPVELRASPQNGSVELSWAATTPAVQYCVYVSETENINLDNAASYSSELSVCTGITEASYTVTGLTNGTPYHFAVTAKDANDLESPLSSEVTATSEAPVVTARALNDTGIIWCASNDANNQPCPVTGFSGQDGDYGRDAAARSGALVKEGFGDAGFDFTKIANDGSELPPDATTWSCVRDNVTDLIWEVKTDDGGLRDKDHTYSWFNDNPTTNGGTQGTENGGTCNGASCDTKAYVEAVNAQNLCGASDWRLPPIEALASIHHSGKNDPAIDINLFPNTLSGRYWTATSSPYFSGQEALSISFNLLFGNMDEFGEASAKSTAKHVRLVRYADIRD